MNSHLQKSKFLTNCDIELEEWATIFGDEWSDVEHIVESESINLPDISIPELKKLSGAYLCGGGRDECLSEFRFLLEAFNIRHTLLKK